jgi:hypothetical protein
LPAVIIGNNANATEQAQDPSSECTTSKKTIWYRLTPPKTAYLQVDTHGSENSMGVSVWQGSSLATLSEVACSYGIDRQTGGDPFGRITFKAKRGVTYFIRVSAGYVQAATPGGVTRLSVKHVTPPSNDDAANATRLTSLPFDVTISNVHATTQPGEPRGGGCFWSRATVWYRIGVSTTTTLRADTFASNIDTVVAVLRDGPSLAQMATVGCNDDTASGGITTSGASVTWHAVAGTTYWIQAGGYDNETGSIDLHVQRVSAPANDDRANANAIPNVDVAPFDVHASTRNATPQPAETINSACATTDEVFFPQSVWYRYTAPNTDPVRFTISGGDSFGAVLSLSTGGSFATQHGVACSNAGHLVLEPAAGSTYYLQVAGVAGGSGNYRLLVAPEH